ncbi:hypothetical protein BD779DRAFT_1475333 [Infundibulicybe gibba]|nr:hypothetical protein BD779DRAFT_1475333 [Infundibulicybe gibba]
MTQLIGAHKPNLLGTENKLPSAVIVVALLEHDMAVKLRMFQLLRTQILANSKPRTLVTASVLSMSESDISDATELDILDEMTPLPTSGRGAFPPGPNGFDRFLQRLRAIFPLGLNDKRARSPVRSGPSPASGDSPPSPPPGAATPRLPGHYTAPKARHSHHDDQARNQSSTIETPSKNRHHQPARTPASAGVSHSARLWDDPDEPQNERSSSSQWEQDRSDGDLSAAVKHLRFSEPPESQDISSAASSPPESIRQLIEASIRACNGHTATPKQIRAAAKLTAEICECDDSVDRIQQIASSITPQPASMVKAIIRSFPKDSIAAQKAHRSMTPHDHSQASGGEWPGDMSNIQSPRLSTRSGDVSRALVAEFQQVSDSSSPFQPIVSDQTGFSESASTRSVQDNSYKHTLVVHNANTPDEFEVDVTTRSREYQGRPEDGKLKEMRWFHSAHHRDITPKLGEDDNPPERGDLYIHTNTLTHSPMVWMYTGERLGSNGWFDITDKYYADRGAITHPLDSEKVLTIRESTGEPSFILKNSFKRKQKLAREKQERLRNAQFTCTTAQPLVAAIGQGPGYTETRARLPGHYVRLVSERLVATPSMSGGAKQPTGSGDCR